MSDCCIERGRFDRTLICSPCQDLVLFGWAVPTWAQLAAIIIFAAVTLCVIASIFWTQGRT